MSMTAATILREAMKGVQFMHEHLFIEHLFIHRDLKPRNIGVDENPNTSDTTRYRHGWPAHNCQRLLIANAGCFRHYSLNSLPNTS